MSSEPACILVARQPIFDVRRGAAAYELLYRPAPNATGSGVGGSGFDGTRATAHVIVDGLMSIGLDRLSGGRPAFINFTEEMIREEYAYLLPKRGVVIEVLESVEHSAEVLEHCQRLKDAGYSLALDDFVAPSAELRPFMELADVIKVDLPLAGAAALTLPQRWRDLRARWLAEKVETAEDFASAADAGYHYFQGYFFRRPTIVQANDVPAFKGSYLRVLHQLNEAELDFEALEGVLRADVGMSYRLLRYVNSVAFGWRKPAETIRQALTRLGAREFRKWAMLVALVGLGVDKPQELLMSSLLRANLAELLAPLSGLDEFRADLFLTGLFSQIDAIVGRPLEEVLDSVGLAGPVQRALLERQGPLSTVLATVAAFESGDAQQFDAHADALGLTPSEVQDCYLEALERTRQVVSAEGDAEG